MLHNPSALAQESATRIQTELYSCFESCLDSCETVASLGTVARTPQSHDHVLVVFVHWSLFVVEHDIHSQFFVIFLEYHLSF